MSAIDYFDRGVLLHKDREALVSDEGAYTYRDLKNASVRVAAGIIGRGDHDLTRLAVYSHNTIHIFPCLLGAMRAGNVLVPANARDEVSATAHFLNLTKTKWFFYHSSLSENVAQLRELVPSLEHFVCLDRDNGDDKSLQRFMDEEGDGEVPEIQHDPHRHFYYYATGGTTGFSKAVIWDNLVWDTFLSLFNFQTPTDEPPVHLCVAPISHTAGPIGMALFPVGVTNIVLSGFDPLEVMKSIEKHRVTHLFLPPTALYAMLSHPEVRNFDYSSLKYFLVAAAPVAPEKIREAIEVFGPCLCQAFGQAEAPACLTWVSPAKFAEAARNPERAHLLKSCGQPTLSMRVAIMDDDGNLVPNGERGEIVAQGNLLSVGYLDNPEATEEMRKFGWHHTGDIGIMDDEGYIYIVDRIKDLIISKGINIYPRQIEEELMKFDYIKQGAVIGVEDPNSGEVPVAYVELEDEADREIVTPNSIKKDLKAVLANFKVPKTVIIVDELPKTATGKVLKRKIKEMHTA